MNDLNELSMVTINACYHLGVKLPPQEIQAVVSSVDHESLETGWPYLTYEKWFLENFSMHFVEEKLREGSVAEQ